jgi:pterin-4a-carbinolamine dehydratase
VYAAEEMQGLLDEELPHWELSDGQIQRRIRTSGWKGTLMVVNAVGHLAEAAWHHPELNVSYNAVVVRLITHSENGLTDMDLELARKIEEFVFWRPGDGEVLEGTPADPRYVYIHYDT